MKDENIVYTLDFNHIGLSDIPRADGKNASLEELFNKTTLVIADAESNRLLSDGSLANAATILAAKPM